MPETFPTGAIGINGFTVEVPGIPNIHVDEVEGLEKKMGLIEVVDGGSNVKTWFTDHVVEHSEITLSRIRDGSPADALFAKLFDAAQESGGKIGFTILQTWPGKGT